MASVNTDVNVIQGLAATLGLECDYREGNFVVAANAGACLGLGGSGSVAGKVAAAQIGQFLMCIAHQLKQADYKKLAQLLSGQAFDTLNHIFYLVVAAHKTLESFVGTPASEIERTYTRLIGSIQVNGEQVLRRMEQQLKTGWGWYSYMPPESRGAIIASIVEVMNQPRNSGNNDLRQLAAFSVNELMATTQSLGHLNNTLDRITIALGDEPGRNRGVQLIDSLVAGTMYTNCIARCEVQVAKATPLMGRPFLRNDEPEFQLAQFPLHHPGYALT